VSVHPEAAIPPPSPVNGFNAPEMLSRGHFLEVERFLESLPPKERQESALASALYGQALLARGDLARAREALLDARGLERALARRGELAWALAQTEILSNDFGRAADFARDAIADGYALSPGFVRFLEASAGAELYAGPAPGETRQADFTLGAFDLIRLPARVNEFWTTAVLDTGAAYSIVIESLARQAGVREVPEAAAYGRGLHNKEIPLTFGFLDRLEFAGFEVRNVPVLIMPDDALFFETSRGELPLPMVLGLHLLKEFSVGIHYDPGRLTLVRTDPRGPKTDPSQNLFFVRGRVFVRASVNLSGWFPFLLDTGSEPTLMTSAGLRRVGLPPSSKLSPRPVQGIGKTRVEWGRIRKAAIGIDGFLLHFRDIVVREDDAAFEDGIIGASSLKPFHAQIDFRRMRLKLEPAK